MSVYVVRAFVKLRELLSSNRNSPGALRNLRRGSINNSLSTMMPSRLSSRDPSAHGIRKSHTERRPMGFTADVEGAVAAHAMISPDIEPVYLPHNEPYS